MSVGKKIKALRTERSMTQKELGEKINVSSVSIGCWENGTKNPSLDAIISLSKLFKVTTDYLLDVILDEYKEIPVLERDEKKLLSDYKCLDAYGKKAVSALCRIEKMRVDYTPRMAQKSCRYIPKYLTPSAAGASAPIDGAEYEMIPVDDSIPSDADFAVKIQGESMNPYIYDGDTVYVKRCNKVEVGDIGFFCVDGAMYCKQFYIDHNKNLTLISANPALKDTNIYISAESSSSVVCYGKVLLDNKIDLPDYFIQLLATTTYATDRAVNSQ